jgi:carbamoyltransferase
MTPEHAYRCFMATNIDALVIDDFLLLKKDQPNAGQIDASKYLAEFKLD